MSEHWEVFQEECVWVIRLIRQNTLYPRDPIAIVGPFDGCEAIARRIVLCVNACEGLSTETLEAFHLLWGARRAREQ